MHSRIRLLVPISMCLLAVLLNGCQKAGFRTQSQSTQMAALPPQVGDRLESFSFSSPSGESLAWDAQRLILAAKTERHQLTGMFLHVFQPDCHKCRALAKALERLINEDHARKPNAVGVTHRGDERATIEFVRNTGASYPIAVGTGSRWAHTWGRGDPLYVVDREGRVVYSQVGYEDGDPDVWRMVLADLAADREVRFTHPDRDGLKVGDTLPALRLAELFEDKEIALTTASNGIVFTDTNGREHRFCASIGFFSRY